MAEDLVDISLFSCSPTDDRYRSPGLPGHGGERQYTTHLVGIEHDRMGRQADDISRIQSRALEDTILSKPLPPLPPRNRRGPLTLARQFKRKRVDASPGPSLSRPSQRRPRPPAPLLSLPTAPPPARHSASTELIWMQEEQMWLVVGDGERENEVDPSEVQQSGPPQSPQQPTLSVTRARSEPVESDRAQLPTSPRPSSSSQSRTRELSQERDEERLSPLFHEAMSSVPLEDTLEPPPPPSYESLMACRSSSPNLLLPTPPPSSLPNRHSPTISPASPLLPVPLPRRPGALSAGNTPITTTFPSVRPQPFEPTIRARSHTESHLISPLDDSPVRAATGSMSSIISPLSPRQSSMHHFSTSSTFSTDTNLSPQNKVASRSWSGWARKFAGSGAGGS